MNRSKHLSVKNVYVSLICPHMAKHMACTDKTGWKRDINFNNLILKITVKYFGVIYISDFIPVKYFGVHY